MFNILLEHCNYVVGGVRDTLRTLNTLCTVDELRRRKEATK